MDNSKTHFSVRNPDGSRYACLCYKAIAEEVAGRNSKPNHVLHVIEVQDSECKHGFN